MKEHLKNTILTIFFVSILVGFFLLLSFTNYSFARTFHLTENTQKIFWKGVTDNDRFEAAGGQGFQRWGGGRDGSPAFKHFAIKLDDELVANYSYSPYPGDEDVFRVSLAKKEGDGYVSNFVFYVNQKNLKVIKDDSKHRTKGSITPEERIKLDKQNTPDSITDVEKLEKLAIQRLVKFQDEYYKNE